MIEENHTILQITEPINNRRIRFAFASEADLTENLQRNFKNLKFDYERYSTNQNLETNQLEPFYKKPIP